MCANETTRFPSCFVDIFHSSTTNTNNTTSSFVSLSHLYHSPLSLSLSKGTEDFPTNMEDSRRELLEKLLSQNFDSVSSICVITIAKYVSNILSNPNEPKYRTIHMLNKAFQEKVLACKVVKVSYLTSIPLFLIS